MERGTRETSSSGAPRGGAAALQQEPVPEICVAGQVKQGMLAELLGCIQLEPQLCLLVFNVHVVPADGLHLLPVSSCFVLKHGPGCQEQLPQLPANVDKA